MFNHKQNLIPPPAKPDSVSSARSVWTYILIPIRLLPYFVVVILILAIGIGIFAGVSIAPYYASLKSVYAAGLDGRKHLQNAQALLVTQKFKPVIAELEAAEVSFIAAREGLNKLKSAALFQSDYLENQRVVAEEVLEIGVIVSQALADIMDIGVEIQNILQSENLVWQDISPEKKGQILSVLYASTGKLEAAGHSLGVVKQKLIDINKRQPLFIFDQAIEPLADKIPDAQRTFDSVITVAKLLPALAGFPEEKTYLFILENNREMRPSGGFIGTYGILKVENASINAFFTDNSYNLDQPVNQKQNIPSPEPMKKYMNQPKWFFRDANWWPDWPTSAQKAEWFYHEEGGKEELDGVIAVTPTVVEKMLAVLGEFKVGDLVFNQQNVGERLQYEVEYGYYEKGIATSDRKDIVGALGGMMLEKLYTLPMNKWGELVNILSEQVKEKQILVYFNDEKMQGLARENGWAGELKPFDGDYVMLVDANLAALKTDSVMDRTMKYSLTQEKNGDVVVSAAVTYQNLGTFSWKTTRYRTFTRLYVPSGSELIEVKAGKDVVKPEDVTIENEFGKRAFGVFFEVEPQTAKTVAWKYKLPGTIVEKIKQGEYSLLVQKQPGILKMNLQLDLTFTEKIRSNQNFLSGAKNNVKFVDVIRKDEQYTVWLGE